MSTWLPWPSVRWWLLAVVLVAAGALATSVSGIGWGPAQWHVFAATTREGILLPALVAVVFAAQLGRVFNPRSVVVGRATPRAQHVVTQHLLGLGTVCAAGYTIGIAPVLALTVVRAEAGRADLLALGSVYLTLIAIAFLAYLLSAVLRTRWAIVTTPVVCALVVLVPAIVNPTLGPSGRSTRQSAFVWLNDFPLLGWHVTTQTSAFRCVFFVAIALACALTVRHVVTRIGRIPIAAVAIWGTVAAMAGASILQSPHLVRWEAEQPICDESAHATICLHPGYASLSKEVAEIVAEVVEVMGPAADVEVLQQEATEPVHEDLNKIWFHLDRLRSAEDLEHGLVAPMVYVFSGGPACDERFHNPGQEAEIPADLDEAFLIHLAIAYSVHERLGLQIETGQVDEGTGQNVRTPAQDAFHGMGTEQFQSWLSENESAILTCSASNADLP